MVFFCILLHLSLLEATELKIHYNHFRSTIKATTEEISYKDMTTDLSLKKKKCNSHILERLYKELNEQSKNLTIEKVQNHPMTVTIDGVQQTIDQRSAKGQFFHRYVEAIKQAKIEEMLNCK